MRGRGGAGYPVTRNGYSRNSWGEDVSNVDQAEVGSGYKQLREKNKKLEERQEKLNVLWSGRGCCNSF